MEILSTQALVLAVVQDRDLDLAISVLEAMHTPVVYLSSVGGFLGVRNATLLITLRREDEKKTIAAVEKSCQQRVEYLAMPMEGSSLPVQMPVPVTVGGATVFVLPVEKFFEI